MYGENLTSLFFISPSPEAQRLVSHLQRLKCFSLFFATDMSLLWSCNILLMQNLSPDNHFLIRYSKFGIPYRSKICLLTILPNSKFVIRYS